MAISSDERATVSIIRENSFPVGVVEGTYKGERRVFMCRMERGPDGKMVIQAPLAMLIDERDIGHVKNELGQTPTAEAPKEKSKIIVSG